MLWVNEQWLWREIKPSILLTCSLVTMAWISPILICSLRKPWGAGEIFFFLPLTSFFKSDLNYFLSCVCDLRKVLSGELTGPYFRPEWWQQQLWLEHFTEDAWHKLWLTLSLLKSVCQGNQSEPCYLYSQWLLSVIVGCISPTVRVGMTLALLHSYWISIRSFTSLHWQLEETVSSLKSWKRI